jgi:hypothetical protein
MFTPIWSYGAAAAMPGALILRRPSGKTIMWRLPDTTTSRSAHAANHRQCRVEAQQVRTVWSAEADQGVCRAEVGDACHWRSNNERQQRQPAPWWITQRIGAGLLDLDVPRRGSFCTAFAEIIC